MFRRLFKFISGVNQEGEVVEMTRPVSTLHKVGCSRESLVCARWRRPTGSGTSSFS
jgi:hypothetical protein